MNEPLYGEDELRRWLISQGFRCEINRLRTTENACNWYAYKRSSLQARRCEANPDKPGVQVVVWPHLVDHRDGVYRSVEIEVSGKANGTWWNLISYGLSFEELKTKFPQIEQALVAAWNSLET